VIRYPVGEAQLDISFLIEVIVSLLLIYSYLFKINRAINPFLIQAGKFFE